MVAGIKGERGAYGRNRTAPLDDGQVQVGTVWYQNVDARSNAQVTHARADMKIGDQPLVEQPDLAIEIGRTSPVAQVDREPSIPGIGTDAVKVKPGIAITAHRRYPEPILTKGHLVVEARPQVSVLVYPAPIPAALSSSRSSHRSGNRQTSPA
ncbi:hypothetical protein [Novosphingobium sp. BW1]|uniref:hypothetical protein n=1 Tax=Novosphingobium sp. BW1 TaxID=2592621 RepID=UPI0011DEB7B1|nr:hypothetical protein [Novosphingobium sp. BW1]TYC87768.1 hypothetical protein FMM79_11625 [Novosphingobium sp. BW1]